MTSADTIPLDRPLGRLTAGLFLAGLIAQLTISAPLLTAMGVPYDAPTGNFAFKLHPATYLFMAALAAGHLARGNPAGSLIDSFRGRPALLLYAAIIAMLLVYTVVRYGFGGSAFLVETMVVPVVCATFLGMTDRRLQRLILALLIGLVTLNALIGLGESLLQRRLVPHTVAGGVLLKEDTFRSTALLGHPLVNALVTGTMMVAMLAVPVPRRARLVLIGVLLLGLLSFGGRTSLIVSTAALLGFAGLALLRGLFRGRFSYTQITGGLVAALLVIAAVMAFVAATGVGQRIFNHMLWDHSAGVRVQSWNALSFMNASDLLFGVSQQQIQVITFRLGLLFPMETIENFWLLMLMQMGVVGFIWFVVAIVAAGIHLCRGNQPGARLAFLVFIVVASSNNSLGSKSCELTLVFIALTCIRSVAGRPGRAAIARQATVPFGARPALG